VVRFLTGLELSLVCLPILLPYMKKKLFICAFIISLVGAIGLYSKYKSVEKDVVLSLNNKTATSVPAIYSHYELYTSESQLRPAALVQLLTDRQYQKVTSEPTHPGEYLDSKTAILLLTRPFHHPERSVEEPQLIEVSKADGSIRNLNDPQSGILLLEPVVIETLGGDNQRASDRIALSDLPPWLPSMVLSIEDERFNSHFGVDPLGIARAVFINISSGKLVQGGSTITQQLAKNLFFSPEKTLNRKVKEALAAIALERHLSKAEVLEMYLNEVYLGQEGSVAIHGVSEAARAFFGKPVYDLVPAEGAMLAGIIQAPSYFSPRRHPERAEQRRNVVLDKTLQRGMISPEQHEEAIHTPLTVTAQAQYSRKAPYFVTQVRQGLPEGWFDKAAHSGLKLHTSLHYAAQRCAENSIKASIASVEKKARRSKSGVPLQVGLVAIEPASGLIRAWAGGREYSKNQFDHVAQAKRQIGSTIKPFLYLTALDANLNDYKAATPISILPDSPLAIKTVANKSWVPENYDHKYRGDVTLRYALEKSLNVPAAYISTRVELKKLVDTLTKFRVAPSIPAVPSLALGSLESTLLDLTSSYAALANQGSYVAPRAVIQVTDALDTPLLSEPEIVPEPIANPAPVYVLTNMLQGVIDRGTGAAIRSLGYKGIAAGKTGTSNDSRDSWFIGYTPDLSVGVWVGYDDNSPTNLTGGSGAAPIWSAFMQCMEPLQRPIGFTAPPGVVAVDIDPATRRQPCDGDSNNGLVREVFVEGTEPPSACDARMAQHRFEANQPEDSGEFVDSTINNGEQRQPVREPWPPQDQYPTEQIEENNNSLWDLPAE
jgi:penicillin-binding protein 1B